MADNGVWVASPCTVPGEAGWLRVGALKGVALGVVPAYRTGGLPMGTVAWAADLETVVPLRVTRALKPIHVACWYAVMVIEGWWADMPDTGDLNRTEK